MSRDQLAVLIVFLYFLISFSVIAFLSARWSKKHCLYYVVFRSPDTRQKYCVEFFRSKSDLKSWLLDYSSCISLFGVYSLVPDAYLKEFGGFYSRSK